MPVKVEEKVALDTARGYRLKGTKKPGRPRKMPKPEDFDYLMNLEEAGQCLGITYTQMRVAVYDHDIPVMKFGKAKRIARPVVQRILDAGEFEAGRIISKNVAEEAQSDGVPGQDIGRTAVFPSLPNNVYRPDSGNLPRQRVSGMGSNA